MTAAIFYVSSIVFSATAIFALWQLGLKKLMLDDFRDSLFVTRDRLYALAKSGTILCDDDAYRSVELFINRTIRYAHQFTFLSFFLSVMHLDEAKTDENDESPSESVLYRIGLVKDEHVRAELTSIVGDVAIQLPRYIAKSSLMFMLGSILYIALRSVSPLIAGSKEKAIETFEFEAYRYEKYSRYSPA